MDSTCDELTPRERDVLDLANRGLSNNAIALHLGISRNAVRYHLKELHSKLDTGGDRNRLAAWRKFRGWLPAIPTFGGASGAKVAVGAAMGTFAIAGAAAAFAFAGNGVPPDPGQVVAVDGRYPNGCPEHVSTWQATTLQGFAAYYHGSLGSYEDLATLNPGLVGEQLAVATDVSVPYNPNAECGEAKPTPAGSTPEAGGTPASDDPTHAAEVPVTPAGASPVPGGTPSAGR